jgi:hypothetical protein
MKMIRGTAQRRRVLQASSPARERVTIQGGSEGSESDGAQSSCRALGSGTWATVEAAIASRAVVAISRVCWRTAAGAGAPFFPLSFHLAAGRTGAPKRTGPRTFSPHPARVMTEDCPSTTQAPARLHPQCIRSVDDPRKARQSTSRSRHHRAPTRPPPSMMMIRSLAVFSAAAALAGRAEARNNLSRTPPMGWSAGPKPQCLSPS